jgi:hypothetical protein
VIGAGLLWILAAYQLASLSAWFIPVCSVVFLSLYIWSAQDAFSGGRRLNLRVSPAAPLLASLAGLLIFWIWVQPNERTLFLTNNSNLMEPTLLAGDYLALDRLHSSYVNGDLVVSENDDRLMNVRRIQELKTETVVLTTDNPVHNRTEEVPLSALRGKVKYVLYSTNPDADWKRTFKKVK